MERSPRGRTVLLGWELGGGFGHAHNLLRVARALAADGHRPVLAAREAVAAWPLLRDASFPVLPIPVWSEPAPAGFVAASFADILRLHGYASDRTLLPLLRQWDGILDVVRPDLVVLDYAPTLGLAAAGRVPTVDIGNGFCQPPADLPAFPPYFRDQLPRVPRGAPEDLLAAVRAAQVARGRPAPAALPGIAAGVEAFVTTVPELDPYREARRRPPVGPLVSPVAADGIAPRRFFAYLSAEVASTEPALTLLAAAGLDGEVYVRGATAGQRERLRGRGLTVHDTPPPLADVLPRVRAVAHHAGLGTAEAALLAGRPQLLLPEHLEHQLYASAAHRLGVAHYLAGTYPASDVAEGMRQLLDDPAFARRAAEVAADLRRRWPDGSLGTIVGRCRELLDQPAGAVA
ncbi:hypothetical protein R5W24_006165 [Gemmata sp. JC717]|uniref:nucleotide disphospho-sugar-binding domain-containing protein n=1 Tax=Gemmata algarum TaxID=2975278 RepID=UPI0021BBB52A|nr:nucleotide disphospho-sugar-binding domain-containing protein [Gemmata algarum]MDY3556983.1 hypothetical protein [Gemmata algarum]